MKNIINSKSKLYPVIIREYVIKAIRAFFDVQGFHEIQVPVLNKALPLEPTLYSFKTSWNSKDNMQLYLSTSPESALKKIISQGIGNCYSIGSSFRNLEDSGSRHNPEFLMLEWYRADANYNDIIEDCKKLIDFTESFLLEEKVKFNCIDCSDSYWSEYTIESLFKEHIGRGWLSLLNDSEMHEFCKTKGLNINDSNWEQLFNQLFLNFIEDKLTDSLSPVIIKDFPAKISPLCKKSEINTNIAERFELYINGMEIGNGNSEQLDANLIEQNFVQEKKYREEKHERLHPYDMEFIRAVKKCPYERLAGIGLGIDRFAMIFAGVENIGEVNPFIIK
ncbi:MAG TPA: hypothetical protein PK957_04110 [Candidatus Dojkabacteria bacterium]|nr:hypothetical protein [Candidatus Dojkabacteria bacterium]HQF36027.1 hypothetical protein [Candidatus Dojkabacteria bacterium]